MEKAVEPKTRNHHRTGTIKRKMKIHNNPRALSAKTEKIGTYLQEVFRTIVGNSRETQAVLNMVFPRSILSS